MEPSFPSRPGSRAQQERVEVENSTVQAGVKTNQDPGPWAFAVEGGGTRGPQTAAFRPRPADPKFCTHWKGPLAGAAHSCLARLDRAAVGPALGARGSFGPTAGGTPGS